MQVIILCGGYGTRMGSATETLPKPMVEVGGRPLLWHVMKAYSAYGLHRFVLCLGYKGDVIRGWVSGGYYRDGDLTVGPGGRSLSHGDADTARWTITLAETGYDTLTGGRLLAARRHLDPGAPVMMTYGDGVADVDLDALLACHRQGGRLATVTAMRPRSRFGTLDIAEAGAVTRFQEKPLLEQRVSGGFFVLEPGAFDYLRADEAFEQRALSQLAEDGQLSAHPHDGFWMSVDTPRDLAALNETWKEGRRPWLSSS
ncbi:MAG: NTP transferase domain-containing protein [Alphaproteobacteria bacterium]|nr:NTP transferase domain-containing protein [Alphaproteobacteria bacterium]MCB9795859.1 NTP transferase domain-containing protein [Alphaproteobacteria bacterium]